MVNLGVVGCVVDWVVGLLVGWGVTLSGSGWSKNVEIVIYIFTLFTPQLHPHYGSIDPYNILLNA